MNGFPAKRKGPAGVTMLEVVMALFIVAVLALVAVSRRSGVNIDAVSDGETLKAAIRNTRTRAMADVVPWSFQVAGQTGTFQRNGVAQSTLAFATTGVAAGAVTFDNRGTPTGTMSFAVADCPFSPVTVTAQTGFVP